MPTSLNGTMRCGLSLGYPLKFGWPAWAAVKKATGSVDPMCSPYWAAAPADMTISSARAGFAMRPCTTVTRSVEKYSASVPVLPSSAGRRLARDARSGVVPEHLQGAGEADDVHRSLHVGDPGHGRDRPSRE